MSGSSFIHFDKSVCEQTYVSYGDIELSGKMYRVFLFATRAIERECGRGKKIYTGKDKRLCDGAKRDSMCQHLIKGSSILSTFFLMITFRTKINVDRVFQTLQSRCVCAREQREICHDKRSLLSQRSTL